MSSLAHPEVFKAILDAGVLLVTVLMMLTVGMELNARHFAEVTNRVRSIALLLGIQALLLPLLGIGVVEALALPPHLSAGILLIAACPVGDIANFYTLLARGNTALSLTLNTLSCLHSAVTMTVAFAAYDYLLPQKFTLAVPPVPLIARLVLMLLLPVFAGAAIRRFWPKLVALHLVKLRHASLAGILLLLAWVFLSRREQLAEDWRPAMFAGLVFMLPALALGFASASVLRLAPGERITSAIVFAARNVGLATAIAITMLGKLEYAVFGAVYFLTEVPLLFGVVTLYRRSVAGTTPQVAEGQS